MHAMRRFLGRRIGSELCVGKLAQIACYVVAVGFLVLALRKIASLQLTEAELFFGLLLVLAVFLLMFCLGSLVRIEAELANRNDSN